MHKMSSRWCCLRYNRYAFYVLTYKLEFSVVNTIRAPALFPKEFCHLQANSLSLHSMYTHCCHRHNPLPVFPCAKKEPPSEGRLLPHFERCADAVGQPNIRLGSHVAICGKMMTSAVHRTTMARNGHIPLKISSRDTSDGATDFTEYTTMPRGGVIIPA